MKDINVLIIASSDMNGTEDDKNLSKNVVDIEFPCSKYIGKPLKENEMSTSKSPRCNNCHYTEVEHKYGYPLYPLHPIKIFMGKEQGGINDGKPLYSNAMYSDFWSNKYIIFERIKMHLGEDININYQTITPTYKNDSTYLPTIERINKNIKNKLKLKGEIKYEKPYHYSCMLDEIYKQKEYNGTRYDCIFVVSGGLGWLYTPENFKLMTRLLVKDMSKPAMIINMWYTPSLENPEYNVKFKVMNPINSCLRDHTLIGASKEIKKDIKECISNYTKILLDNNKFTEAYETLFRVVNI